jgi:SulP family sulfate permease
MPHNEFKPRLWLALKQGYSLQTLVSDLFSGITVGIIALPLAMAFAIASGVTPDRGLFTAIVAGFLISILGGSKVQIGGPTGAFVVVVYGIVQKHGYEGLATATLMAGMLLICLGLARFGRMIKFIPYPVTTGFTTGIAVIIFTSQIKDFFGFRIENLPAGFIEKLFIFYQFANTWNPWAVAIGVGSLAGLIVFRRFLPRVPGSIIVVIAASAIAHWLKLDIETIGSKFGGIPSSLPSPHLPPFSFEKARLLVPEALTIAILAGIESLLSAVIADGMTGERHSSNLELVAQGVANIGSVIFGGIPATGAIARTAANVKSGAKTPVSGIVHAVSLLAFMVVLAPLASSIPLSCLAAILFMAAWNMSELDHFRYLLRAPRSDVLVLLSSFALTVLVDITVAVEVGIVLAALLFMKEMSAVSDAVSNAHLFDDDDDDIEAHLKSTGQDSPKPLRTVPHGVEVFQLQGPFFFGVVDKLKDVLNRVERPPLVFILRTRLVPVIDASGLHALRELYLKCHRQNMRLILSGVQPKVKASMEQIGLLDIIGTHNLCRDIDHALEVAQQELDARHKRVPPNAPH